MTKRIKIIGLGIILLSVSVILHFQFGLFSRYNLITAYLDKWSGNERIIIYGEPFKIDSVKSIVAPTFGFKYERKADCNVTTPFVNGVKQYNEVMSAHISKRIGGDWDYTLEKKIFSMDYQKVRLSEFDFSAKSICEIKNLQFIDIYKPLDSISGDGYEKIVIAERLKALGFTQTEWGRGNFQFGPRVVIVTLSNGTCDCEIAKHYFSSNKENEYIVTESIDCELTAKK